MTDLSLEPSSDDMEIEVNFDFIDPRSDFVPTVRTFLTNFADKRLPAHSLATAVCEQVEVGTFIVGDTSENPEDALYGFLTLLDFSAPSEAMEYLRAYVASRTEMRFEAGDVIGLLVSERMINLPLQLLPVIHSQLLQDMDWAYANAVPIPHYTHIVLLSRCQKLHVSGGTKKRRKAPVGEDILFGKLEEQLLVQRAQSVSFFSNEQGDINTSGVAPASELNFSDDTSSEKFIAVLTWRDYVAAVAEMPSLFTQA
jgi:hypothetical protein